MGRGTPVRPGAAPDVVPPSRRLGAVRLLRPGWPLSAMFIGFPLWWALGLVEPVTLTAAAVMAVELVRRREVAVPRGFGLWLLFLVWVAVGALVVQVDVPGAVPGDSATRYLTAAYRLTWYLRGTVVLLYVMNLRRELTTTWVMRTLGWMFVTTTVGGLAGMVVPTASFPSLVDLVLPGSLRTQPFVQSMVHPVFSELQNNLGGNTRRPSAPFAYANEWGFNLACFLPFFVGSWCGRDAGWRRVAAPFVLLAALLPVIFSLNRGLWLALVALALFATLRSVLAGRLRVLGVLVVGVALVGVLLVATPLGSTIATRLENGNSDSGRTDLAVLTLTSMGSTSPVVGLGTTRQVQGGFESIAQGSTPGCPRCTPPALGTQGQLWLVAFSQGFGGLVLYFGFLVLQLLRHIRNPSPTVTVGLGVVVVHLVTAPVYGADNLGQLAVMAGIGLVHLAAPQEESVGVLGGRRWLAGPAPSVATHIEVLRRRGGLVLAGVAVGVAAALVLQHTGGERAVARVSLLLPEEPAYLDQGADGRSLDTEAQLVRDAALEAARASEPAGAPPGNLDIAAVPNSRILVLTYTTAAGRSVAAAGASAAATEALRVRQQDLRHLRAVVLRRLTARSEALRTAIATIDETGRSARADGLAYEQSQALTATRAGLISEAGDVGSEASEARSHPFDVGTELGPPEVTVSHDHRQVLLASGAAVGGLLGLLAGLGLEARSSRLRRRRAARELGHPLIPAPGPGAAGWPDARGGHAFVGVDDSPATRAALAGLEGSAPAPDEGDRAVLVASARTRTRAVREAAARLESAGTDVVGVLVARDRSASPSNLV